MRPNLPDAIAGLIENRNVPPIGKTGLWVDEIELLVGTPMGHVSGIPPLPSDDNGRSPREAIEAVVRTALLRSPCVVTFSGGRDSSTVLAVAAHVARRDGLPPPIPVTHRFPGLAEADESEWQESVIRHLELDNWERLTWSDEMDALGPFAQRSMHTTGVGAPFNQHFILPMIDLARGGSVLTGMGGDELFTMPMRKIANRVLYRRSAATWRDARGFASQVLLQRRRRRRLSEVSEFDMAWISPEVLAEANRRVVDWLATTPIRFDRALGKWWWTARMNQVSREQMRRLGVAHDVSVEHPFTASPFMASFAAKHRAAVPPGRAHELRKLAGDLLPEALLTRTSKTTFDGAFNSSATLNFVEGWTGEGVNADLVDLDRLREAWSMPGADARSMLLLQSAWFATNG